MITIRQRITMLRVAAQISPSETTEKFHNNTADVIEGLSAQYNKLVHEAKETVLTANKNDPAIKYLYAELKSQGQL